MLDKDSFCEDIVSASIHPFLFIFFFAKTFLNSSSFEQVEQLQEKVRENSTYEKNIEHKKNKLSGFWRERLLPII